MPPRPPAHLTPPPSSTPPSLRPAAGLKNGPTASRPSVLLMDPSRCYWEVQWEGGRTEELAVGTHPSHTCLRVSGRNGGYDIDF